MAESAGPAAAASSKKPPSVWVGEVRRAEREGELFLAYDLARQGLRSFRTMSP